MITVGRSGEVSGEGKYVGGKGKGDVSGGGKLRGYMERESVREEGKMKPNIQGFHKREYRRVVQRVFRMTLRSTAQ